MRTYVRGDCLSTVPPSARSVLLVTMFVIRFALVVRGLLGASTASDPMLNRLVPLLETERLRLPR